MFAARNKARLIKIDSRALFASPPKQARVALSLQLRQKVFLCLFVCRELQKEPRF